MFTGIVEEMGRVVRLTKLADVLLWNGERGEGWELVIAAGVAVGAAQALVLRKAGCEETESPPVLLANHVVIPTGG